MTERVSHHSKLNHHPGKTSPHPSNPYEGMDMNIPVNRGSVQPDAAKPAQSTEELLKGG